MARSKVRLVNGQFVFDSGDLSAPLSRRISGKLRDPLSDDQSFRETYQSGRKQMIREQEIRLVDSLIAKGAQFDDKDIEELSNKKPGEILDIVDRVQGKGLITSKYSPEQKDKMYEALELQIKNKELEAEIKALGGDAPPQAGNKGPGLMARAFDLLSRGNYMTAEAADRQQEANDAGQGVMGELGAFFQGAWGGLSGKDKTTWHDNLKEHGLISDHPMKEGKPTGVLGFILDVGLDPTTYLTLGTAPTVKGLSSGVGKALGREVTEEVAEELIQEGAEKVMTRTMREGAEKSAVLGGKGSRGARRTIRVAAEDAARTAAKDEAIAAGKKLTRKQIDEIAKKAGDDALRNAEDIAAKGVADEAVAARRATEALSSNKEVQLKVLGRRVAGSEKLYRPIRGISDAGRATKVGSALNKAFRTDAEMNKTIHFLDRMFRNRSSAQFEDELKQIQKAFSGSTKAERNAVTHALEAGSKSTIAGSSKMVQMFDDAQAWFDRIATDEIDAGLMSLDDKVSNYVYHVYNARPKRVIGKPIPAAGKKFNSIAEAAAAGARPVEDIADILAHRLAKSHRVVSRADFHREIANRFGMNIGSAKIKDKALRRLTDSGYLKSGKDVSRVMPAGVYFDTEVSDTLLKLEQFFESEESIKNFWKQFDRIQAKLKFGMTAPNPGFHIRNLMGDLFVNMLDGVVDPRIYTFAGRMLDPKFKGTLRVGKHSVSADYFRQLYEGMGLKSGFFHAETGLIPSPGRKGLSKASGVARTASEKREDFARMAHFIDAMRKEASSKAGSKLSMNALAEKASMRVKKFNFDYQDLTRIEQKGFRRAVPFYTFMRKNIPLQLEMMATRPGRVAVAPKALRAMQEIIGEDVSNEVYPGLSEVFPDWIRNTPGLGLQAGSLDQPSIMMSPDLPVNQLQEYFGGFVNDEGEFDLAGGGRKFLEEIIGGSSPFASIPAEWALQRDLQSGAPVDASLPETILNQLPAFGAGKAAIAPNESQAEQQVEIGGHQISERLLNYLTGAGIRVNNPQRQKSQLKRDEDVLRAILAKLEAEQGG